MFLYLCEDFPSAEAAAFESDFPEPDFLLNCFPPADTPGPMFGSSAGPVSWGGPPQPRVKQRVTASAAGTLVAVDQSLMFSPKENEPESSVTDHRDPSTMKTGNEHASISVPDQEIHHCGIFLFHSKGWDQAVQACVGLRSIFSESCIRKNGEQDPTYL